ncbi:MAG: hypothetical protein ACI8P3_002037 [Saprospiraceae bacterium]|jgi:hypothetical protein
MKINLLFPLFLLFFYPSISQSIDRQLLGSAGESSAGETISLDWTMGESFNAFSESSVGDIKEGFLQTEISLQDFDTDLSIELGSRERNDFSASIFPNPFNAQFTFQLIAAQPQLLLLSLFDYTGKMISSKSLDAGSQNMDWNMSLYPAGLYFLKVVDDSRTNLQIYKIIKQY